MGGSGDLLGVDLKGGCRWVAVSLHLAKGTGVYKQLGALEDSQDREDSNAQMRTLENTG